MILDPPVYNFRDKKHRQILPAVCILCLCLCPFKLSYGVNNNILLRLKEIAIEADKTIDQTESQEISELVLRFVEYGHVYILSSSDTDQLRNRIDEFCTLPLSDEIYERSLGYLGIATSWNGKQVKSINLLKDGDEVEAVIHYLELAIDDEVVGAGEGMFNLKRIKVGWRIYRQHYESALTNMTVEPSSLRSVAHPRVRHQYSMKQNM